MKRKDPIRPRVCHHGTSSVINLGVCHHLFQQRHLYCCGIGVNALPAVAVRGREVTYSGAITVYNLNGQTVARGKGNVSLNHLSSGIYVIQGRNGSSLDTVKVAIN